MYGFRGVGLSEVQLSISELSVVGGWWVGGWSTNALHGRTFTGSDNNVIYNTLAYINSLHLFMESTSSRVNEVLATLPESFCSASFQGVVHPAIGSDKNPTGLYPEEVPV